MIDEGVGQADRILQRGRVLQPRQGGLRTQVRAARGQPPAGEFEGGIGAQEVEIVGVLITAGDSENAGADHVGERVGDARGIALIGEAARQTIGDAEPALGHRKQQDAAVAGDAPAIESGDDFFAANRWKLERQEAIFDHGGRDSC